MSRSMASGAPLRSASNASVIGSWTRPSESAFNTTWHLLRDFYAFTNAGIDEARTSEVINATDRVARSTLSVVAPGGKMTYVQKFARPISIVFVLACAQAGAESRDQISSAAANNNTKAAGTLKN